MRFPSREWFAALQERASSKQERFKRLGFVDATMGVLVTGDNGGSPSGYVLEFSGYGCKAISATAKPKEKADFVLVGPYGVWKEMIENIRANGEADLHHTLNVLTLPSVPLKVEADDQLKADLFFRYNETFQEFFNGASEIETEFER